MKDTSLPDWSKDFDWGKIWAMGNSMPSEFVHWIQYVNPKATGRSVSSNLMNTYWKEEKQQMKLAEADCPPLCTPFESWMRTQDGKGGRFNITPIYKRKGSKARAQHRTDISKHRWPIKKIRKG
jgi:hypothetical protein